MTPSLLSHPRPGSLLIVTVVTLMLGVVGCGARPSATSSPPATATAAVPASSATTSSSAPPDSAAPASTPAAPKVTPVPAEKNPPGDIPDNLAFVPFTSKRGGYSFTHPEGWARTGSGVRVRFTDKLNGVTVESLPAGQAPTVASARAADVTRLRASVPAFELRQVAAATLPGGTGVHLVFRRNSDPDPVTGKVYRDEVEEYDVFHAGRLVRMQLFGPVGADNVDAYRTMSQSLVVR